MPLRTLDLNRFLREVSDRHTLQKAHPFCFILGAGASVQSEIPAGRTLVDRWLADLHKDAIHDGLPIDQWATATRLRIKGFEYRRREEFYGQIYARRFEGTPDTGHAELQTLFAGKEASFGYSILAYILATTQHKAVITTNFDNLVAEALYLYGSVAPILCLHESLASFVTPQLDRPLVVKIHRDLLLSPLSADDDILALAPLWNAPLVTLFSHFTPIFIGYGGNDGSLMGFLESLPESIPGRIYWCVRTGSQPNARVRALLEKRSGNLIAIPGFDELMLALKQALAIPDLLPGLEARHRSRVERYTRQFGELSRGAIEKARAPDGTPDEKIVAEAAVEAVRRVEPTDTPDSWRLRAEAESDLTKAEALYRQALDLHPGNSDLISAFGRFLADRRFAMDEAEAYIKAAWEADPENHARLQDYGRFLWFSRGDGRAAEPLLRKAAEQRTKLLGPEDPATLVSRNDLANALRHQGKPAEAEQEHRAVLALRERVLGPEHPATLASRMNLANALANQGKYAEAEQEDRARIAIEERVLGAEHPDTLASRMNLTATLHDQGKHAEAEREYRAVLALQERVLSAEHPHVFRSCYNLAGALLNQEKYSEALIFAQRAERGWQKLLGVDYPDSKDATARRERIEAEIREGKAGK